MDDNEYDKAWMEGYEWGQKTGWDSAILLYKIVDCTIRNNGEETISLPLRNYSCYLFLEPGEEASIRTVV